MNRCVGCNHLFSEIEITQALRRTLLIDGKLIYICLKCERVALEEWARRHRSRAETEESNG